MTPKVIKLKSKRVLDETPLAAAVAVDLARDGETPSIPLTPDSFSNGAFGSSPVADEDDNFENLFGDAPASSGQGDAESDGEDNGDLDVPDFLR
jgi:hypothetical protein